MLKVFKTNEENQSSSRTLAVATGQADVASIRTETWQGRVYTIVPVVAIVEGVLFGANAATPELALASEFGKFPAGWNGRPVTMNHPQLDGVFVSAAIPEVMDAVQMGMMFNTQLDDKKLKTEAWIDNARVAELGGIYQSTLDRILAGDIVEVSVGAYIETVATGGTYNGKNYSGTWSNVTPDHLAFLEEGTIGACSVKDGCGTPRLNQAAAKTGLTVYSTQEATPRPEIKANCECQESAEAGESETPDTETGASDIPVEGELSAEQEGILRSERRSELFNHLVAGLTASGLNVNAIAADITLEDARRLIYQELQALLNVPRYDIDVMAMTNEVVVYYVWGTNYVFQQITYSVASDGKVTFTGDPSPVNLLTRIQPRQMASEGNLNNNERNDHMPGAPGQDGTVEVNPPASTDLQAPTTVSSFAELLAGASPDIRAQFDYGMQAYNSRKTALIDSIKALSTNKFTVEQLATFDVPMLENLAQLGNVASFSGRALPGENDDLAVNANGGRTAPKFAAAPTSYLAKKEG